MILAQPVPAQFAKRESASKGPRALGLIELTPSGKAHLIPVVILNEGKFYDASAYKASPVPMALESGTVYEAVRTGVSEGLFTVAGARQANNSWIGEGTWQSAGAIAAAAAAAAAKKQAALTKPAGQDLDAPPVLRRPSSEKASEKPKPPEAAPAASAPAPAAAPPQAPPPPAAEEDKDRPVLRRGKPSSRAEELVPSAVTGSSAATSDLASAAKNGIQIIPAISDAGGPDPRPYAYSLKPEEEQAFRKKMLALAASEINSRARQLAVGTAQPSAPARTSAKPGKTTASKAPQPGFEDVQLRVFDLSNSNEPVLVLTARARMPLTSKLKNNATVEMQYMVALVAREDIYGELHKAFSSVTDTQHLDAEPRMELIDAVDADGDGRGELLFRRVSDAGSAFVVYRVIGNQLWPLFEGTAGK